MKNQNDIVKIALESNIPWGKYPPFEQQNTVREKAYWLLCVLNNEFEITRISAPTISKILTKKFRKVITHQAVRAALNDKIGEDVETFEDEEGTVCYSLMSETLQRFGVAKKEKVFSKNDIVIPFEIFEESKGYIKNVVFQINGCYRDCYYDACAIMLRRLFETLIIEIYEKNRDEESIKDPNGIYIPLSGLIKKIINDNNVKLSVGTKNHIPKIKLFGDVGAHSRKIKLRKSDIERYIDEIRLCAEELMAELSGN